MLAPGTTAVALLVFVIDRSASRTSGSVSLSVLLSGVGSAPLALSSATVPVLVIEVWSPANAVAAWSTRVTVPLAPAARLPRSSVSVEPDWVQATLGLSAERNDNPAGIASVIFTPVAPCVPTFA